MASHSSFIQSVNLSTNTEIYLQIIRDRASISFEGKETSYSNWLTIEEMRELRDRITEILQEASA